MSKHKHKWIFICNLSMGNYFVCDCGKEKTKTVKAPSVPAREGK